MLTIEEKKKQWAADYYARNRERLIARASKYAKDNREKVNACHRKWNKKHPEYFRLKARQYAKLDPERVRARARKHYHTKAKFDPQINQKRKLVRARRKLRNPNYQKEHYHRYKLTPNGKAKINAASLKRRSLKKAATVNLAAITEWLKRVRSKDFSVCYYCDKRIPTTEIHIDHIVALANGGAHSVDNLCVACNHCNASKGAKPIRAWIRMGQQILEL